jgi:hypothetical protein
MPEERVAAEIQIAPMRIVSVTGEVRDIFAVIRGLKETQYDPEVRFHDEELGEPTCWQPTSIAPEGRSAA